MSTFLPVINGVKKGSRIVELATGKKMLVTHNYMATTRPIALHFDFLANYVQPRKPYEDNVVVKPKNRSFRFSEEGKEWAYDTAD